MYMYRYTYDYKPLILSLLCMPLYDYTMIYMICKKRRLKKVFKESLSIWNEMKKN